MAYVGAFTPLPTPLVLYTFVLRIEGLFVYYTILFVQALTFEFWIFSDNYHKYNIHLNTYIIYVYSNGNWVGSILFALIDTCS